MGPVRRIQRPRGTVLRGRARRVGIALGAGGARGLAHIGVLRALGESEVPIHAVVGTSIGALVGAAFAAGQLERFERETRSLERVDLLRLVDPVWPRAGLLSGDRVSERLHDLFGDWRIEDLALPFGAVAVDLVTGEEVLIRTGPVIEAVRSSLSIPGIFVPPRAGKRIFVDGAIRNPVPVSALGAFDVDVSIAVNLHGRPVRELASGPRKRAGLTRGALPARIVELLEGPLVRRRRRSESANGPSLVEILAASMTAMEGELARYRLAADPVDVVLTPRVHAIRSFEFHRARQAIHAGREEVRSHLGEIRTALRRRRRRRRA
ncbi:MAG: patatin-like phospholipase family protein [Myxococcota bacterium]